jgi:hypothetical protein
MRRLSIIDVAGDTSVLNHFTPKARFPTEHDMQVKVSGQFYVLAGLDASLFMGLGNAQIVEARIGPTQSFNLGFENDQACADYAVELRPEARPRVVERDRR